MSLIESSGKLRQFISTITSSYSKLEKYVFSTEKNTLLKWTCATTIFFVTILILNILTPTTADDFGYSFIFGELTRISSLSDIIQSQYNHYINWGGRSVVHFIAQLLLLLPPLVADILNSVIYILYIYLIYKLIIGRGKNSLLLFILIHISVWLIQPAFGDTILWITGSSNYLWGTTLILLFILPYRLYQGRRLGKSIQIIYLLLFFLYGILAGWTNENSAAGMIVMAVLFLGYYHYNNWRIPAWAISGIVGALLGYAIMIAAPGNAVRAGDANILSVFIVSYRFLMHSLVLFLEHGILILSYAILLILYRQLADKNKTTLPYSFIFAVGSLVSIYVMILSPSFPPRAWFGVLSFITIGSGILFYNLHFAQPIFKRIKLAILAIGSVCFLFSFYLALKETSAYYSIYQTRRIQVKEAIEKGEDSCQFERYVANTKYVHTEDEGSNNLMTWYYGINISYKKELRE